LKKSDNNDNLWGISYEVYNYTQKSDKNIEKTFNPIFMSF